ncbi:MAG: T9SS type A sorting domain-containing protein [Saprospiraceae bacterium]|nr:T9SS type A sorting domain-containing protein [Saprospiraceae bacterium]
MKIKLISLTLLACSILTLAFDFSFSTDPVLPTTPYDYSVNLPAHFLTDAGGPLPTSINGLDNTPVDNPITNDGATLGRVLFYDTNLSSNRTISCASCHKQNAGFSDPSVLSSGFAGGSTRRHSMTLLNSRYYQRGFFFWDERAASLEAQVLMPFQDPVEMGLTLSELTQRVSEQSYYSTLFTKAFGDNTVTTDRISKALAQFVRSIVSYTSKYDAGRVQVNAPGPNFPNFTTEENLGKQLFIRPLTNGGAGCFGCHTTESFNSANGGPQNNGLDAVSTTDLGAFETFPNTPGFRGRFKTSTLRNIELTAPYMHDGRFQTLEQVIEHYNSGIQAHQTLSAALKDANGNPVRLNFTTEQKNALVAFLKTLTDNTIANEVKWSNPFPSSPVPIELLSFIAKPMEKKILLEWQTATERNNDNFTIEKSLTGEKWETIGTVKGAGQSNQKQFYSFIDTKPVKGIQYFRLKQTDFDRTVTYSKVVSVQYQSSALAFVKVYPNPANTQISVGLNPETPLAEAQIQLINVNGQVIMTKKDLNTLTTELDISNLSNGIYFVKVITKEGSKTMSFMKN